MYIIYFAAHVCYEWFDTSWHKHMKIAVFIVVQKMYFGVTSRAEIFNVVDWASAQQISSTLVVKISFENIKNAQD